MPRLSETIRHDWKMNDAIRDAGLEIPADIAREIDICYGKDAKWQMLDVYRPKNAGESLLPVIVSVHGGAWVYGDKELYQHYCMDLAKRGFAVVNFTYRLAPEFTFPAPLEDTNLVMHWIFDNAAKYHLDTEHIFAVGDSAGAHLLSLYTEICTNASYAKQFDFKVPEHFVPTAIALNCGDYEISFSEDESDMTRELMKEFLKNQGTPEELGLIDATKHMSNAFPPTFIMTCSGDFLKSETPKMVSALLLNEVSFVFRYYTSEERILGHVFHLNMKFDEATLCNDDECDFFKTFL